MEVESFLNVQKQKSFMVSTSSSTTIIIILITKPLSGRTYEKMAGIYNSIF